VTSDHVSSAVKKLGVGKAREKVQAGSKKEEKTATENLRQGGKRRFSIVFFLGEMGRGGG